MCVFLWENFRVATDLEQIIRHEGAIPATIAIMKGKIRVGLSSIELENLAKSTKVAVKASLRDLSNVLADVCFITYFYLINRLKVFLFI